MKKKHGSAKKTLHNVPTELSKALNLDKSVRCTRGGRGGAVKKHGRNSYCMGETLVLKKGSMVQL